MPEIDIDAAADSIAQDLGLDYDVDAGDETVREEGNPSPVAEPRTDESAAAPVPSTSLVQATQPRTRPDSWRKEALEHWEQLPDKVREEVLRREEDYIKGIGQAKWLPEIVAPFEPILKQQNVDPKQLLSNLMNAHFRLSTGTPDQKKQIAEYLFKSYNLGDLASFYQKKEEAAAAKAEAEPYMDPGLKVVNDRVEAMNRAVSALMQKQFQSAYENSLQEINKFASDPENEFFHEVSGEVQALLKSNPRMDLKAAYRAAVFSNPVVAKKEVQRLLKAEQKRQQEDLAAQTKAAKANLKSVHRPARPASDVPKSLNDLGDTMAQTLAEIKSRAA